MLGNIGEGGMLSVIVHGISVMECRREVNGMVEMGISCCYELQSVRGASHRLTWMGKRFGNICTILKRQLY